jgi:hypothetical protein
MRSIGLGCGIALALFALIVTGAILALDGYLAWVAYCQIRAQNYPTTMGVITHSEVESHAGGKRTEYTPNVQYRYAVAGNTYSSNRYRFGELYAYEGKAHQIVAEHPVGKQVRVSYDPDNPADALLQSGLDGGDLFLSMFLLPLNLVILVLGSLWAGQAWRRAAESPAGGARMWDDGFQVRVRLSQSRPYVVAAVVAGLLAFGSLFVALGFGGAHPPMTLMVVAWCVVLAAWLLSYIGCVWKLAQGGSDLVIDTTAQQVALPQTTGRNAVVMIPMRAITSVDVEQVEKRGSRGEKFSYYVPTLAFTDASGATCRAKLVQWFDRAKTEELAAWLRGQLRLGRPE